MNFRNISSGMLTLIIIAALTATIGASAFFLSFTTVGQMTITSVNPADWSVTDTFDNIDVTNSSASTSETIQLVNTNSNITYKYLRDENISPVLPAATCNISGDVTISAELNSATIDDSDIIVLGPGTHTLITSVNVVKSGCPADLNVTTDFVEQ